MTKNLMVFPNDNIETKKVAQLGCTVLAMYPNQLLVRCDTVQEHAISKAGIKTKTIPGK